jgi:hypothetical protein
LIHDHADPEAQFHGSVPADPEAQFHGSVPADPEAQFHGSVHAYPEKTMTKKPNLESSMEEFNHHSTMRIGLNRF